MKTEVIKNRFRQINHKKLWIDSMIGMTIGFLATLVVGTIIGLFGIGLDKDNKWHEMVINIKNALTYITPFGIGVGVAYKLKLNPIQILGTAIAVQVLAQSSFVPSYAGHEFNWSGEIGINIKPHLPGDVFASWIGAVIFTYLIKTTLTFEGTISVILIPLLGAIFGIVNSFYLPYITSTILTLLKYIIDKSINKNYIWAVVLAPIVGVLMGLALSFPTSSVAIAVALHLEGYAATAAIAGTAAQMISFGVMTYMSNKSIAKGLAVGFGSSMIQMHNFMRKPSILIIPCIASGLAALIGVAAVDLPFVYDEVPSVTPGMGACALYGQIYTLHDIGWDSLRAWMNVVFIQLMFPSLLTIIAYKVFIKQGWLNIENLKI